METDKAWEAWGQRDPYFGVLTDQRFSRSQIESNREDFFASGTTFAADALARFARAFGASRTSSALDFGCGVGRLSLALAAKFDRVVGLDISLAMLDESRANAQRAGRQNTVFALADDSLSGAPGMFDWVNCYIVLQHIPTKRGMAIVRQLLAKVAPGGGCLIHVSVQRSRRLSRRIAYWIRFHAPLGNGVLNALTGKPWSQPPMQMNEYPAAEIVQAFHKAGIPDVLTTAEDHGGTLTLTLMGRRQATPLTFSTVRCTP